VIQLFDLKEIRDSEKFGNKALQLGVMLQQGFPVPNGFVIGADIFANEITDYFWAELKLLVAAKIKDYTQNGFMVRSSAIGEDSEGHSFAGQLESYISSSNIDEIIQNIQLCVHSAQSERVLAYQQKTETKLRGIAVIIQELIDPDFAGVTFTRSFLEEDAMLTEYVQGHGNKLVAGEVTPNSFHYFRHSNHCEPIPQIDLSEGISIAKKIETFYGTPMDIEWAMKDNFFYVVQARPITTSIKTSSVYWSNTNVNENYPFPISPLLYSVARDAYYNYFKNLAKLFSVSENEIRNLEPYFCNVIGVFACKMYYNMSSIHRILSASPFADLLIKSFDNFVGYNEGAKSNRPPATFRDKATFIREFFKLNKQLNQNVKAFEKLVDEYHLQTRKAITPKELEACFHGFIEIRMYSWYKASLADFFAMAYHGILGKFCAGIYGEQAVGIHNKLIQAIPNIISSKPVLDMYAIIQKIRENKEVYEVCKQKTSAEFYDFIQQEPKAEGVRNGIELYLNHWGFRCSGELMLTEENYIENPVSFIALLQQYEKLPDQNPGKLIAIKQQESKAKQKELRKKIFIKYLWFPPLALIKIVSFNLLLKQSYLSISCRERARLKQALLYFRFKTTLQSIEKNLIKSGTLQAQGDILFLTYKEISELLHASDMLPIAIQQVVTTRKKAFETESTVQYPDDFYTNRGVHTPPDKVKKKEVDIINSQSTSLNGLCACGGFLKGRIVVLQTVLEADKIREGDILVTRQTDPGWVVVFPLISGLIVERGGMLSHGAIVSREFGIPAVVGVPDATTLLKDGDMVELDADKGEIRLCL
jgi:rifampicin phosphotransferase